MATKGYKSPDFYNYRKNAEVPLAELKKEYSRLRAIYQKRRQRLEKAGLVTAEHEKMFAYQYPKVREITSPSVLRSTLRHLYSKVRDPITTVTGMREFRANKIARLQENYPFVNESNFNDFVEFMEMARQHIESKNLPSDAVASFFDTWKDKTYVKKGNIAIMKREFTKWAKRERSQLEARAKNPMTRSDIVFSLETGD